jgi:uncharacterized linocin/CFP29 family protein
MSRSLTMRPGMRQQSRCGLVIDPRAGTLRVGQDLQVGYSANDGIHHKLFVSESLVLVLSEPRAISTLDEA